MFETVLMPVDMAHPEKAGDMIKAAQRLGDGTTKFIMANIIHSVPAVAEMAVPQEYFDVAEKEARETLANLAQEAGIKAVVEVRIGHPANDILVIAEDHHVNLIIVGSHRPGLQDYLIGSTASRVVRHAQCPVLVMR
ncbi:MAG: universal stress protein [Pseudomonadota bacterium]